MSTACSLNIPRLCVSLGTIRWPSTPYLVSNPFYFPLFFLHSAFIFKRFFCTMIVCSPVSSCRLFNGLFHRHFFQATCCPDKLHCCPSGYKCDVKDSSCIQDPSDTKVPWDLFTRRRARVDVPSPPPSVVCPTETHNCPSNNSCCQSQDEDGKNVWSCCPYPNVSDAIGDLF